MFCCTCLGPGRKGSGNGSWQELVFAKTPMAWREPSTFFPTPLKAGECQETECGWSGQGAAVLSEPLVSFSATSLACPPLFLPFSDQAFEELIHRPRDGCGGDLVNYSGLHPSEVGSHPTYLVYRPEGTSHACNMSCEV